jgi:hypothetical protein
MPMFSRTTRRCVPTVAVVMLLGVSAAAQAQQILKQEPPAGTLRPGQKVLVDDGTCPAGEIKEVTGHHGIIKGDVRKSRCVKR